MNTATLTTPQPVTAPLPRPLSSALHRACLAARIAADNKGRDVLVLDMRPCTPLFDFFVLATGTSRRQVHTLAEEIDDATTSTCPPIRSVSAGLEPLYGT